MHAALLKPFHEYPEKTAPFQHQLFADWSESQPLAGLRVLHHIPLVPNSLLKTACLVAAGADVTVTNPTSFMSPHPDAISSLEESGILYVSDLNNLSGKRFDIYFDCGGELYQTLGKPDIGAVELTGSGDEFYRNQTLDFPVVSVDRTLTKQLETVFGCGDSINTAITDLKGINPTKKSWVIFGFGKIGRGIAYFCTQHNTPVAVVDTCEKQRLLAKKLGLQAIDPQNTEELQHTVNAADIVITATGKKAILNDFPHDWFNGKILANMGVYDEFGPQFSEQEVLNNKKPINFILRDPTEMKYIDPELYLHNVAALFLIKQKLENGVHGISTEFDHDIIQRWCMHHSFPMDAINRWFIRGSEARV